MNICRNCNKQNDPAALFCENCGMSLKAEKIAADVTVAEFCSECGHKIAAGALFCDNCGYAIDKDGFQANNGSYRARRKLKGKLFWAAAILILLIGWIGISLNQFNNIMTHAERYLEEDDFESAYISLGKADGIFLPFTDDKIRELRNEIDSQKEAYTSAHKSERNHSRSSNSESYDTYSSSEPEEKEQLVIFASVDFEYFGSVKDPELSVTSQDFNQVKVNYGDNCHLSSFGESIKGTYDFIWTFDANNNFLLDPDIRSYRGSFYIDGKYENYMVYISEDIFGSVEISVTGI